MNQRSPVWRRHMHMIPTPFVALLALATATQQSIPVATVREELRIVSNDSSIGTSLTAIEPSSTVLPDGRIVTVHGSEGTVRVFDSRGRFLSMLGGRGDGPGEYRSPQRAGHFGDSVWVYDLRNQRFVVYTPDLKPVRFVERGPGGANHGLISSMEGLVTSGLDSAKTIATYDVSGQLKRNVGVQFRIREHQFEIRDPGLFEPAGTRAGGASGGPPVQIRAPGIRTTSSPLGARTEAILARGGKEIVVVEAAELWGGRPGQFTMRRLSTTDLRMSAPVTVSLPPRRVERRDQDSILTAYLRTRQEIAAEYRSKVRFPEHYPAFLFADVSHDGLLWLTQHHDRNSYVVVEPSGRVLMRVPIPQGLTVFAMDRTHLWGTMRDANDLPIILRYGISLVR